jgi:ADP-ribose pyrophosphatase YjhB (NUDIX family)
VKQIFATYEWRRNDLEDKFNFCPQCATPLNQRFVAGRERRVCPECGFVHYRNPFPAVSLLIVVDERVALGRRANDPGRGLWALPSGYVEFDDDFLTAGITEAREETGLDVQIESILNVQSAFLPDNCHFLTVYLLATVSGGELAAGDDMEEVGWFSIHEPLPELAFATDGELIRQHARGRFSGLPVRGEDNAEDDRPTDTSEGP